MYIPFRIRLLHNFGRSSFIIGFLFAIIGLSFVVYFSTVLNWRLLLADKDDFTTASARITGEKETSYTVNELKLHEYSYNYSAEGMDNLPGSFLEFDGAYRPGQQIRVEYLSTHPETSRIFGKDRRNFDQIMLLGGLGGVVVAIFFLYPSVRKTRQERKILLAGKPAMAKLIHAEPTNLNINEQTVYNLTFEYSAGNIKPREFSLRSHMIRNISEENFEAIIYDPENPDQPVLIDTLPRTVARYVNRILADELTPGVKVESDL